MPDPVEPGRTPEHDAPTISDGPPTRGESETGGATWPDVAKTGTGAARPIAGPGPGDFIGPYRLVSLIGEGGFGLVYLAEQDRPIRRRVAVKLVKPGMDSAAILSRFDAERQALALMDHPCVAKVFDAGTTTTGRPYFVMEYVSGIPVTDFCDRGNYTTEQRLELFTRICEGIQHAHQKGVIHRDLKPSNVLVSTQVEGGREVAIPKVIDFGVAKAISSPLTERAMMTEVGQIIGTPEYMSPEQAENSGMDIDTRSDVYSLGVLLYELLTGTLPFDSDRLRRAAASEIHRIIREVDPPRPSTRVSSIGEGSPGAKSVTLLNSTHATDTRSLVRRLRGDLDWITMRALEKDRARRYDSPSALAADIRRHLASEPVLAGPPTAAYRLSKFARRNKGALAAGTVIVLTLIAGLVASTYGFVEARRQRDAALLAQQREARQRENAEKTSGFLTAMLSSVDPDVSQGREVTVRYVLDEAVAKLDAGVLGAQPATEGEVRASLGRTYRALSLDAPAEAQLRKALEIAEREEGLSGRTAGVVLGDLAQVLDHAGRVKEAEEAARRAVKIQTDALGENHADTAVALGALAHVLQSQQRWDDAEPLYRRVIEIQKTANGEDHADTIRAIESYGLLLYEQQKFTLAEPLLRDALARSAKLLGGMHPTHIDCLNNMALLLLDQGRLAEAEAMQRESLDLTRRVLGPTHADVGRVEGNLAAVLREQGKLAEAEDLYRKAIAHSEAALGARHPAVANNLGALGGVLRQLNRHAEAEPLFRRELAIDTAVYGPENPGVARDLSDLATVLSEMNRLDEAEPLAARALEMYRTLLGPDHIGVAAAMNNLAMIRRRQGKLAEAEPLFRESGAIIRRSGLEEHPHYRAPLASTLQNLGWVLIESGRASEAEPALRECIDLREKVLPKGAWETDDARSMLGGALTAMKKFDEAEPLLVSAHAALTAPDSQASELVRKESADRLAALYAAWGKPEKAATIRYPGPPGATPRNQNK